MPKDILLVHVGVMGKEILKAWDFRGGEIFVVFVVEHWTTNEATLPTFTCSASSNHEYINHELTRYC